MRFHGPNVVSFEKVIRPTRTPLVGVYLPHSTLEHLSDFKEKLQRFKWQDSIVLVDINAYLDDARSSQIQSVADLLIEYGLIEMVCNFRQRLRFRDLNTWTQVRQDTFLHLRCNYILGTNLRRFELVGIRYVRKLHIRPLRDPG